MSNAVTVKIGSSGFATDVQAGSHTLRGDEPTSVGGTDTGPTPYDFLLGSLGTCTAMTLRMYANRKEWPLEGVEVDLTHERVHARDCEDCETEKGFVTEIKRDIRIIGDQLTDEQRERLLEIADRCPVHRTLTSEIKVR